MKHFLTLLSITVLLSGLQASAQQCYNKGSLLVSVSEGATYDDYSTSHHTGYQDVVYHCHNTGDRDPLTVEYGLSKKWGIGVTMGGDLLSIDPGVYGLQLPVSTVKVITSEITVDGHYHFFVTRKVDLSIVGSLGLAGLSMQGDAGDRQYKYLAGGTIRRAGVQGRYYLTRRFGVHAMVTGYTANTTTDGVNGNTVANNYNTSISGVAWELGFCYRFIH